MPPDEFNLFSTEALTTKLWGSLEDDDFVSARTEQLRLFTDIEDGTYSIDQVALRSIRAERAFRPQATPSWWRRLWLWTRLTRSLYRAARISNTMSALASGNPSRIARRGRNVFVGRSLARAGVWRALWGGGRRR